MERKKKTCLVLLIVFALLGEALSIISLKHFVELYLGLRTTPSFCSFSARFNCDAVTLSKFSTLYNVPIATYGAIFYFVLMVVAAAGLSLKERVEREVFHSLFLLSFLAFLYSIYLFVVSEWILGVLCPTCIAMYACNLGLLISSYCGICAGFRTAWREGARYLLSSFPRVLLRGSVDAGLDRWVRYGTLSSVVVALLYLATPFAIARFLYPEQHGVDWSNNLSLRLWQAQKPVSFSFINEGVDRDFSRGNPFAPAVLVEFSDLECPACHAFSFDLEELLADFGDTVRVVFKNFPLDKSCNPLMQHEMHQNACFLAQVARCAGEQDRFWETAGYFMSVNDFGSREKQDQIITDVVKNMQLDEAAVRECVSSRRHLAKIQSDISEGEKLRLEGTPTVYVNGKKVPRLERGELRAILKEVGGKD